LRKLALLTVVVSIAAGCGGGGGLRSDLAKTASNLGKIRSGSLDFSLLVTPRSALARNPFGFSIRGPFTFGDQATARVAYTQIANGSRATVTLVLEPTGGYVVANGKRRPMTEAQLASLRDAAASARSGSVVDVSSWLQTPTSCGTHCARGKLDVSDAVEGIAGLAGDDITLSAEERKQLDAAAKSATYLVRWTDDHLLEQLKLHVVVDFDVPPKLRSALGNLVGATFDLNVGISDPAT
jgi:hypothetical protein